ncbi:ribosome maturation factor RimM [Jatrophihabitans endophyticus]|uniref:ribosome maturation factor RimM n=1 Tax=Jatrophihabitans endophyticus TaxID=1206085 RepID=UPI0019F851BF|nr:ribosome maturation factor RimM [Jatrophihabitans endophyticus]MBE7187212.1 ribosome maturation factor RimM [Jatrophihabitans endophyticus]
MDELIAVGRIGPPRGVRGDVFVEPFTDTPDERFAPGTTLQTDPPERGPLTVEALNLSGARMVLRFEGLADRTAVEALRGVRLVVPSSARAPIEDPDEFYTSELVGLAARTAGGAELGPVKDVIDIAGADYLVLDVGGTERLVPFVSAIVPTVSVAGGFVEIDPPEGLFDL